MDIQDSKYYIFYDGDCGFCNFWVQKILKRDVKDQFLFASLQSNFGQRFLKDRGLEHTDFKTIYLWKPNVFYLTKSSAAFGIAKILGGKYALISLFKVFPKFLTNKIYDLISENRKSILQNSCYVPPYRIREKKVCLLKSAFNFTNSYICKLMEYNTQRTQLHMPEYGRIIQEMVEICKETQDKEERNKMAITIVDFMGQRNPQLRDEEDYVHKLWDHLYILADYDLDVDAPYKFPTREELMEKPKKMEYPKLQGDYKFYGKSILQLIEKAIVLTDGEEKEALIEVIANNMKKSYNIYNKEHVTDDVIFRHLKELSDNRLDLTNIESLEKSKIYHSNNNNNNNNRNNKNKNPNNRRKVFKNKK